MILVSSYGKFIDIFREEKGKIYCDDCGSEFPQFIQVVFLFGKLFIPYFWDFFVAILHWSFIIFRRLWWLYGTLADHMSFFPPSTPVPTPITTISSSHHRQNLNHAISSTIIIGFVIVVHFVALMSIVFILSQDHHLKVNHILILNLKKRSKTFKIILLCSKLCPFVLQLSNLVFHSSNFLHQFWFITVFRIVCHNVGKFHLWLNTRVAGDLHSSVLRNILFPAVHHLIFVTQLLQHICHSVHLHSRLVLEIPLLAVPMPLVLNRRIPIHFNGTFDLRSLSGCGCFMDRGQDRCLLFRRYDKFWKIGCREGLVGKYKFLLPHFLLNNAKSQFDWITKQFK